MDDKATVTPENQSGFHSMEGKKSNAVPFVILGILVIIAGVAVGYFAVTLQNTSSPASGASTTLTKSTIQTGQIYGSNDTSTFKDTAEGTLQTGGINGEGQYHLVRPGGDSQNVYLTSSLVDLSLFVGKKVKVWGQTQKAQYAGWLMDVGRIEAE